ncbi:MULTISPECIES: aspartate aminotransferase family protein [Marinobacter]|uniref:Aspartate aminotransferase family protein n=1 Tax=Marinobacter profundi TaxID=2666256 RepID=A0A2G1UK53_9GAMM|nr:MULTISPECIES: aminotransferase class III-fold pyridoxal phosphate-dependent enzyme [Marinobacter]MBD3657358.1 aminotransferase class III-fold pyridoxal phosphate-dependent enzyme [Marinobacter sp.]PHQ14852.1 aspartate aminotransferase family protein [Marinobacter profundi]
MTDHKGKLSPLLKQATGITAERGEGAYIHATDGRRYLDFTSGIGVTSTGHCHPKVVAAAQKQVATMIHAQATTVMNPRLPELAEKLGELTPDPLNAFFFSNAGTEVAEAGIRLVRQATGRPNIIVFHGGFHGRTMGSLSLTTSSVALRAGVSPMMGGVVVAPFPHAHHYGWSEDETTDFCLRELDRIFVTYSAPKETAAMMIEPVQGEGGYVPANARFMQGLRERCDKHGIMLVFDEVQAGFGRSGKFWAHQHFGVTPDAIMIAKGLASGFPISALAASEETMARGWPGSQGGTYGGNAVAAAAAIATIDVIREEGLVENADKMGKRLRDSLQGLQKDYPEMADVRGMGLMLGVEMRRGDCPDGDRAGNILKECEKRGLLMLRCGPYHEIVRWLPPLIVNGQQIDEAVGIFEEALKATA